MGAWVATIRRGARWAALSAVVCAPCLAAEPADLLLVHGKVITVDGPFSIQSAVAVKDGRIIAVGGDELEQRYKSAATIDLHGLPLLPGFIDDHLHPQAMSPRAVDAAKARSIGELQDMIRAKARQLGKGEWITGYGWAEANLAEKRNVLRADLDAAAPDNPVALVRAGGHSIVGNSKALALAGIDRNTPKPLRGVIEHNAQGEPNGIIRERNDLFLHLVPPDSFATLRAGYVDSLRHMLTLGLTSVVVAASSIRDEVKVEDRPEQPDNMATFKNYQDIYAEYGDTLPRAVVEIGYPGEKALCAYPHKTGWGDDRLKLGAIGEAPAVDGGFTGPTAWTSQDYKGQPGFRGQPFFKDRADLQQLADSVARCGWQLGLHAIGDAAIDRVAEVYAAALEKYPHPDARWYLAHFTMTPTDATLELMLKAKILAAAQPNFLYTLENRYVETLDGERLEHINPVGRPLKKGIFIAFGSDNLPIDPRVGLYAAVTRKGMSGHVYGPDEAVSIQEALRMYTVNSAYLSWDEHKKGSIEVGKLADLIVLDRDPLTVPPEQLLTLRVMTTIVNGKVVYQAKDAPPVSQASAPAATPPIPQAEQSDVATLKPLTPRRAFLWSGFLNPGIFIVDADRGEMEGYLPKSDWSGFAIAPGGKAYYVAETLWTHDTRGQRQDLIAVYDGTTLDLQKEIPLPGRALSVPKAQSFSLSESGRYGFVFNLSPASSVVVVDLVKQKTASTVETPGCALVLPYGESGFGSICGDGSLTTFGLDAKAHGTLKSSVHFFDPVRDPVFDQLALDIPSHKAFFVSYLGHLYEATLADEPQVVPAWSLQAAAGLSEPKDESNEVAWRPGGSQLIAYHRPSGRLFILMHVGEGWTHKQEAAEVWAFDAATHTLIRRIPLKEPAANVAVSQDPDPLLLLTGRGPRLTVMDPDSGTVIRTVDAVNGGPIMTAAP